MPCELVLQGLWWSGPALLQLHRRGTARWPAPRFQQAPLASTHEQAASSSHATRTVQDAAAIGVDDDDYGKRLRAFVVKDGDVDEDPLR